MDIVLRKANKSDKAVIEELFKEMLRSIYNKQEVEGYEDDYLSRFFDISDDRIFVAEFENKAVGYISLVINREGEQYAYIDDFCVKKEYRNSGIGTRLLAQSEAYAKGIGICDMKLHVEMINTPARDLYKKHGYEMLRSEGSRILMHKSLEDLRVL